MKFKLFLLILITALGAYLRFNGLGANGLWVDEAWFGFLAHDSFINQEFVPAYFVNVFNLKDEVGLRLFSALCGTLTIPAIYLVMKERRLVLVLCLIVAIFPLFIIWSQLARPYAPAGLLYVLAWRWKWFYIPAIATSCHPFNLLSMNYPKLKKHFIIVIVLLTGIFYFMRGDSGRAWSIEQFYGSSRWFYVPVLGIFLYLYDYIFYSRVKEFKRDKLVQSRNKVLRLAKPGRV